MYNDFVLIGIGLIMIICMLVAISTAVYIKFTSLKFLDKLVIGYEYPNGVDNIFYILMRIVNYGGGFSCAWCARRSKIADKIQNVDKRTQLPFKIHFWSILIGGITLVAGILILKFQK